MEDETETNSTAKLRLLKKMTTQTSWNVEAAADLFTIDVNYNHHTKYTDSLQLKAILSSLYQLYNPCQNTFSIFYNHDRNL